GRLGDKRVTADRLEGSTGRVTVELVVAGHDPDCAAVFEPDLGRAEDVARRVQRDAHAADLDGLAVVERVDDGIVTQPGAGQRLGGVLFPGVVVALVGPLGAGKTHFVRAVAEGLGIADSRVVSSPTFVLIQEYDARLPIYHFDAYRLRNEGEFFDLGAHEYFVGNGVCFVQWVDRVVSCLPEH